MPPTSTAINACDAVILLADASGEMVDISGQSNNFSLELNNEIGDFKVFGYEWKKRLQCGKDASASLSVIYTMSNDEAMSLLQDWYFNGRGARRLQVNVPDNSVGSDRYEAYMLLESLPIEGASDEAGPMMVEVSLLPDGAVDWSVVST